MGLDDEVEDAALGEISSRNPNTSEVDAEDMVRLRGDAIGDTMYSERFVLNTLLKLGKLATGEIQMSNINDSDMEMEKLKDAGEAGDASASLTTDEGKDDAEVAESKEEKGLETNLCTLWDMTVEADVVRYMLDYGVIDIFRSILRLTENRRLTEIVVGIIGNMCLVPEALAALYSDEEFLRILMDLSGCSDSPTLAQLIRLWIVLLMSNDYQSLGKCFQIIAENNSFLENICFILKNSCVETVLLPAIELLKIVLDKFTLLKEVSLVEEITILAMIDWLRLGHNLINEETIEATLEAFMTVIQLNKDKKSSCLNDDSDFQVVGNGFDEMDSDDYIKSQFIFCNIHNLLMVHGDLSKLAYNNNYLRLLNCLQRIQESLDKSTLMNRNYQTLLEYSLEALSNLTKVNRNF